MDFAEEEPKPEVQSTVLLIILAIPIQPNLSGDISPPLSSECGVTPPGRLPRPRVYTFSGCNLPLPWQDHFQENFGKRCCHLVHHYWGVGDSDKRVGPGRYCMKQPSNKATTTQAAALLISCGPESDQDRWRLLLIHQITSRCN